MEKTLSVLTFRMAVSGLEKLGQDTQSILSEIQVSKSKLINPLGRIPISKEHRFWKIAYERTSDPHLALHIAEQVPFGTFPLLEYIGASSQSLFQVLYFLSKYAEVVYGDWHPRLTEENRIVHFDLGTDGISDEYKYTSEFGLGMVVNRLKKFSDGDVPLNAVHFRHKRVGNLKEYETFFDSKVSFGEKEDALIFDKSLKTIPCKNSDNFMLGSLLILAEKMFEKFGGKSPAGESEKDLTVLLKVAIKEQLGNGDPKIQDIAKKIAMSTRTLQRRLEADGTSLSQIVTAVRKELASEFFKDPKLTNEEIALRLGYSTLSAFNRAFKQWHKMTPSQYKKIRNLN